MLAKDGQRASKVLKNNAVSSEDAGAKVMNIIASCGGMDVLFRYDWVSTDKPGWYLVGSKAYGEGVHKDRYEEGTVKVTYTGNGFTETYDKYWAGTNQMSGSLHASFSTPATYYPETGTVSINGQVESRELSGQNLSAGLYFNYTGWQDIDVVFQGGEDDEEKNYSRMSIRNSYIFGDVSLENGKTGKASGTMKTVLPLREKIMEEHHQENLPLYMGITLCTDFLTYFYLYEWRGEAEGSTGGTTSVGDSKKTSGGGSKKTSGGDSKKTSGGASDGGSGGSSGGSSKGGNSGSDPMIWVSIGTTGVIGWAVSRRIRKGKKAKVTQHEGKRSTKLPRKRGESEYEWLKRQAKYDQQNEGVRHPVEPSKGETYGEWRERQALAEKAGHKAERDKEYYVQNKMADYGTSTVDETIGKMQKKQIGRAHV